VRRPPSIFLIDECLSPALAAYARERGFVGEHINDLKRKQRKGRFTDRQIANHALDRDMIVVTNNMSDFNEIYISRLAHPGLVFLMCPIDRLFSIDDQITMFARALSLVDESEPVQESILVTLHGVLVDGSLELVSSRSELPAH
jgi:predicted nuclease of predicted toxin-antitoxin system